MTDRDTAGARWFREDQARRAREAEDEARRLRQKALAALARARAAADQARQAAFEPVAATVDEERALIERILAEPDARSRERLEAALRDLRERVRRQARRRAPGVARV